MTPQAFVDSFVFQAAQPNTAQDAFNQVKAKFGKNAAFSYALANWRYFASYEDPNKGMYAAMNAAEVSSEDQKKIINTYSSASKSKDLGDGYRWESGGFFGMFGYTSYARQFFKG